LVYFEELVTERSGGRITFENFYGGSLFASEESVDAVQDGVVDLALTASVYGGSRLQLRNMQFAIPFAPGDLSTALEIWHKLWESEPAFEEELAGYNIIEIYGQGGYPYDIQSTSPIVTLDDMKGKKLGCAGAYAPLWVEDAGAVAVSQGMMDRYVSLQRGTIDAQLVSHEWVVDSKFYEVGNHYTWVGLAAAVMPWGGIWFNLDTWNSFSSQDRDLLAQAALDAEQYHIDNMVSRTESDIADLEDVGVIFHTMPESEKIKWANLMPDYPAQWADDTETMGKPGWQVLETYLQLCEDAGHVWPKQWGQR
jgi:TRAP-type C4-dicarboxylate transport system substrate-binding protein